jgi:cell division protein FtsL
LQTKDENSLITVPNETYVSHKHINIITPILCVIIALLLCAGSVLGCMYYLDKKLTSEKIATLTSQAEENAKTIDDLKGQISEMDNKTSDLESQLTEKDNKIKELEDEINKKSSSNNILPSLSTGINSPNYNQCALPGCNGRATGNSIYCQDHSCFVLGCYLPRVSALCLYCKDHKCRETSCNSKAVTNGYCLLHSRY